MLIGGSRAVGRADSHGELKEHTVNRASQRWYSADVSWQRAAALIADSDEHTGQCDFVDVKAVKSMFDSPSKSDPQRWKRFPERKTATTTWWRHSWGDARAACCTSRIPADTTSAELYMYTYVLYVSSR